MTNIAIRFFRKKLKNNVVILTFFLSLKSQSGGVSFFSPEDQESLVSRFIKYKMLPPDSDKKIFFCSDPVLSGIPYQETLFNIFDALKDQLSALQLEYIQCIIRFRSDYELFELISQLDFGIERYFSSSDTLDTSLIDSLSSLELTSTISVSDIKNIVEFWQWKGGFDTMSEIREKSDLSEDIPASHLVCEERREELIESGDKIPKELNKICPDPRTIKDDQFSHSFEHSKVIYGHKSSSSYPDDAQGSKKETVQSAKKRGRQKSSKRPKKNSTLASEYTGKYWEDKCSALPGCCRICDSAKKRGRQKSSKRPKKNSTLASEYTGKYWEDKCSALPGCCRICDVYDSIAMLFSQVTRTGYKKWSLGKIPFGLLLFGCSCAKCSSKGHSAYQNLFRSVARLLKTVEPWKCILRKNREGITMREIFWDIVPTPPDSELHDMRTVALSALSSTHHGEIMHILDAPLSELRLRFAYLLAVSDSEKLGREKTKFMVDFDKKEKEFYDALRCSPMGTDSRQTTKDALINLYLDVYQKAKTMVYMSVENGKQTRFSLHDLDPSLMTFEVALRGPINEHLIMPRERRSRRKDECIVLGGKRRESEDDLDTGEKKRDR
ncbi:hypothetical protein ADUPG1_005959 [Aduncisulcus paluster]|uniref:Uncharacterized protein n=1 Tax=Aduncisulcus paluster TaxID=2918883 RepID=A0ABQ5KGA6_9EUKA|nr:hypothetical protein ADUPG1_005959 [Aduncisulcus paluster]